MLVLLPAFLLLFEQTDAQTMQSKCYSCATPNLKNNFLTTERGPGPKIAEPRIYDSYCGGDTWILKERATVNCDGYCFKWTQTLNNSGTFSSMTFRGCYRQMFDLNNQNVPREPTHSFCTFSEKPVPCLSDSSVVESSCWCQGDHCNLKRAFQSVGNRMLKAGAAEYAAFFKKLEETRHELCRMEQVVLDSMSNTDAYNVHTPSIPAEMASSLDSTQIATSRVASAKPIWKWPEIEKAEQHVEEPPPESPKPVIKYFGSPLNHPHHGLTEDYFAVDELPAHPVFMGSGDNGQEDDEENSFKLLPRPIQFALIFGQLMLQYEFYRGAVYQVQMVNLVSPLEFYVTLKADIRSRDSLEAMLMHCEEELMADERVIPVPGPGEDYPADMPCLAWVNDRLFRAIIRYSGLNEAQVFLIDYGSSHLVPCDALYYMPLGAARFAPGFAYFCTLESADSRTLSAMSWKCFLDTFTEDREATIIACGFKRSTHGQLVHIIDADSGRPLSFDEGSPNFRQYIKGRNGVLHFKPPANEPTPSLPSSSSADDDDDTISDLDIGDAADWDLSPASGRSISTKASLDRVASLFSWPK
ncbi:unnamed protein product, partial [Mesorhabditis spiculigera]